MPVNRNALIRYRTIDKCLQNRRRKWTIEDLIDACNAALYEFEGIEKGVSMRTIRLDLNAMRSDKLGYNAPIIVTDKKYYSYEDATYSITNIPLTPQDLNVLQEVSQLLRQFRGFSHFNEVNEMIQKLEDKIYTEQHQQVSVIDFEKNELLTGMQWLDVIYKAIVSRTTLKVGYQSFKARSAGDIIFYPYLLKEYRNRWFLLGMKNKGKEIMILALDRIRQIDYLKDLFQEPKNFDAHEYFAPIVGVTRNAGALPVVIEFWVDAYNAPYVKTKPIHASQQVLGDVKGGTNFSIEVIPNFELERELMGFGEGLKVLSPNNLVRRIRKKVNDMHALYQYGTE
ncbi:WYL domain-containing protein [Pseudoflavitalea sp. G-6-1-2]|uniref:helix-turn-helix transcriptional regulator n=1 Tax=Pseudoflavitalea sp. G-6-1-2 TaxID=2728841 RepID=UPI00146C01EA|nr:WYL domain-containing protein [Pseudoflavitalea sp. G-6-1-2]NML23954.1 WYL domain-containing protein [Pseudoflavitalea sp. G-6-1-2]